MTFYGTVCTLDVPEAKLDPSASSCSQSSFEGRAVVRAADPRSAAAKLYVRCVGRPRARLLTAVKAGALQVRGETEWREIAPALMRTGSRLDHCYCLDNATESWLIAVVPAPVPLPSRRRPSRRHLFRRLRQLSQN